MATAGQTTIGLTETAASAALHFLPAATAAGPIGLAIGAAAVAITALSGQISHLIDGCGSSCTQATAIVEQADTLVGQIVTQYWSTPTRTKSFQAWTLQQLDTIFAKVQQLCQQVGGSGGQRCISDRFTRGGGAPWCATAGLAIGVNDVVPRNSGNILGRCGGWLDTDYDPIAQDPDVQPDPSAVLSTLGLGDLSQITSGSGMLIVVGLAVFVFVVLKVRGVL